MKPIAKNIIRMIFTLCISAISSCDSFVEIDPPRTDLVRSTVFDSYATADAAIVDLYYQLSIGFAGGGGLSVSVYGSLSSDETTQFATSSINEYIEINENSIQQRNALITGLWSNIYNILYRSNAVIEGLGISDLPLESKNQLTGEAKFVRAFCFFYLVTLWGEVPLVTTTNYQRNNSISKSTIAEIYEQIVGDLTEAKLLLSPDYNGAGGLRIRANKGAASALLSRVYLFTGQWMLAEQEATDVIENNAYHLEPDLKDVYRTTSKEAILQLWYNDSPNDWINFTVFDNYGPFLTALRPEIIETFEENDGRWSTYGRETTVNGAKYYGVEKYSGVNSPVRDYTTLLRLSEQYLIRAEAKAMKGDLEGGVADLNFIRARAALPSTNVVSADELLNKIVKERQIELLTEWGHRWLDLKRLGLATQVMAPVKANWDDQDVWYPIPEIQLINNPNTKRPG